MTLDHPYRLKDYEIWENQKIDQRPPVPLRFIPLSYCRVGKRTLRTMARELHSDSGESEDELNPNEDFVRHVQSMHNDGNLKGWLEMSHDPSKNPLLRVLKNGVVQAEDMTTLLEEYPAFNKDMVRAAKKHGCYMFLHNFTHEHYPDELYDTPSLLTSQLHYLQIAIMHVI